MSTIRKRWAFPATNKFIEVTFFAVEKSRGKRKSVRLGQHGCPTMAIDGLGVEHSELLWAAIDEAVDKVVAALRRQQSSVPQREQAREMVETPRTVSGYKIALPDEPADYRKLASAATTAQQQEVEQAHDDESIVQDVVPPTLIQSPVAKAKAELDSLKAFEAKRDAAMRGR